MGDFFSALERGAARSVTNFAKGVASHISNSFHELVNDPLGTFAKVTNPIHTYEQVRDAVVGLGTWMGESAAKLYLPLSEGDAEGFADALGEVGTDILIAELLGRILRKMGARPPGEGALRDEPGPTSSGKGAPAAQGPALPESYWKNRKAPTQVEPGTRSVTDMKPSSRGRGEVYERTTHYDEYGRSIGQTHATDHGEPAVHPNPHHHTRNPVSGQQSGPHPAGAD